MHGRQIRLVHICLYPNRAQVGDGKEDFSGVYLLPLRNFALRHYAADCRVNWNFDLRPRRRCDLVKLLCSESPEFQPAAAGVYEVFGARHCQGLGTRSKALSVLKRSLYSSAVEKTSGL